MAETDRAKIRTLHYATTSSTLKAIETVLLCDADRRERVSTIARNLVIKSRERSDESGTLDAFLREFGLSNSEGIALMCLAEALLRVPDDATLDALIAEKISEGNWGAHESASDSQLVNASVWGLMLAGKLVGKSSSGSAFPANWLSNLVTRIGEPTVRLATLQAMKILGGQFVLGRDIDAALSRAKRQDVLCSFDMLGEGARTATDAERYFKSYEAAIHRVGKACTGASVRENHNVSVKLSALHPRFTESQRNQCLPALQDKVLRLATLAKSYGMGMSLDAEECSRLELSMDVFEWLCNHQDLSDWSGLGFVLQAYQKRSIAVANWLVELASARPFGFMVRLVKGAYWDTEIKIAQQLGLEDYPVFTDKAHTDLSYEACMHTLLSSDRIYCQFATHNARSVAQVVEATENRDASFELQKLHGMGDLLYTLVKENNPGIPVRTYAPVGQHEDLLPYLVRRLLENGANSSFVNRFLDKELPVDDLIADPFTQLIEFDEAVTPSNSDPESCTDPTSGTSRIPLPKAIFSSAPIPWSASKGFDLDDRDLIAAMDQKAVAGRAQQCVLAVTKDSVDSTDSVSFSPTSGEAIGRFRSASSEDFDQAVGAAASAFFEWSRLPAKHRGDLLRNLATMLEDHTLDLASLIALEAGRTLNDGVDEVREAVDFCRYYAAQAEALMDSEIELPGVTGEANRLRYHASGPWLCISPWNFPLAIFIGQITANLAVGNTVIAKPAEQTPLVALYAERLFREAGFPSNVLHILNADGPTSGEYLLPDARIKGVSFTGSHATATAINRALAARPGAITPLVAETGGINCMIVDSTALPEQVVDDVITSAFRSAGQRCSALRVLYLQSDVADKMIELLQGAMAELVLGDPCNLSSDIGPVIDGNAQRVINQHISTLETHATRLAIAPLPATQNNGFFVAPQAWEINSLDELTQEVFGPILHVIRYNAETLPDIINDIRASDFALTMGVHSRLHGLHERLENEALIGNLYINRDTVGAVVGSNPFGGHGLSGTGPKAGGPDYLKRLVREHTITDNITALGGNTDLFNLE